MKVYNQKEHDQHRESCEAVGLNDWLLYECYVVNFRFKIPDEGPRQGYWTDGSEYYYAKGKGAHEAIKRRWEQDHAPVLKCKNMVYESVIYQ